MLLRMFLSLLPTKRNKENYKRDNQLAYLIEHEPDLFQDVQVSDLSDEDIAHLQARLDSEQEGSRHKKRDSLYTLLYSKVTQSWDKGLGALTETRRAELLRDCQKTL